MKFLYFPSSNIFWHQDCELIHMLPLPVWPGFFPHILLANLQEEEAGFSQLLPSSSKRVVSARAFSLGNVISMVVPFHEKHKHFARSVLSHKVSNRCKVKLHRYLFSQKTWVIRQVKPYVSPLGSPAMKADRIFRFPKKLFFSGFQKKRYVVEICPWECWIYARPKILMHDQYWQLISKNLL